FYGNSSATSASNVTDTFIREINGNQPVKGSWHFDEGEGTTAYDTSGNNNDGTINGATWVDGKFHKALNFDGTDDYVKVDNFQDSFTTDYTPMTVSFWACPDGDGTTRVFLDTSYDGSLNDKKGWMLFTYNSNSIKLGYGDGTDFSEIYTYTNVTPGTWKHYVYVIEGNLNYRFYENGELKRSGTLSRDILFDNDYNHLWIGKRGDNWGHYDGKIDEVRIYNRALSAEEISDLYNNYGYTTTNYPGRVLVRKYSDPEPSISVDSYTDQRNEWNKITTSLDISDNCYFDIEIIASGDSNTQVYIDDVRFAYTKDGYSQSIYDNGILFGIDPDLTSNIDCDVQITKFTTTQTETRLTEVDRLLNLLDRSKYLFYMEDNCIYLKQRSASNTLTLHDGQFYAISYEEDARPLKHTCYVNSTGFGEDWKQIGQKIANAPYCMLCDPDGDWILLGSWVDSSNPGHIRKSTDEGKTWTKVKTFSTNGCYPYAFFYDYDNDTIYCMTTHDGVWKSTDGGDT
ncbi:MAG: hypothetical protein DRN09_03070, partial [Thermoplasmata archaeon]